MAKGSNGKEKPEKEGDQKVVILRNCVSVLIYDMMHWQAFSYNILSILRCLFCFRLFKIYPSLCFTFLVGYTRRVQVPCGPGVNIRCSFI